MSATFFDLMKYAATGQASPSMTHFDKMRALAMAGGLSVQSITGVPPIGFIGNGKPLKSVDIFGNTQQTGTPSPDNIIMPEFCGVRTAQLIRPEMIFNKSATASNGAYPAGEGGNRQTAFVYVAPSASYTFSIGSQTTDRLVIAEFNSIVDPTTATLYNTIVPDNVIYSGTTFSGSKTFTTGSSAKMVMVYYALNAAITNPMLNSGSTALPYEPYGWMQKITCAGQTVPIYLGQTQTVRRARKLVLMGDEATSFYNKNTTSSNNSLYYIRFTALQSTPLTGSPLYCTHLQNLDFAPSEVVGINNCIAYNVIYFNFGLDIMNAQPSGNTVEGLKEYLASQYAAGTPVTIWYILANEETGIVNEPLAKIGDYADELHSTIPIPTVKGQNTLTVDTDLQPSSMTITGNIKEV